MGYRQPPARVDTKAQGLGRFFFDTSQENTQGQSSDDEVYFYTYDPQGSLCQTLSVYDYSYNYEGVISTAAFDAYGKLQGGQSANINQVYYQPYIDGVGFGGQWGYERNLYTGLHKTGARFYDATAGRFATRDPIGYKGGLNL